MQDGGCIPQTTLAGPPETRLRDRLADKAVHDYSDE